MIPGSLNTMMLGEVAAGGGATDSDAAAFLSAAGISDPTQSGAVHSLAIALKSAGLWSKMVAIYPFVGGTASAHKWNMKDPRDLDAAYRINATQIATAAHTSNGYQLNSASDVNTFCDLSQFAAGNMSFSFYSKTNGVINAYEMRSSATNTNLYIGYGSASMYGRVQDNEADPFYTTVSWGLFTANRASVVQVRHRANETLGVIATGTAVAHSSGETMLFGTNGRICAWAHIGVGLTDAETSELFTAVQAYQAALGRQVTL